MAKVYLELWQGRGSYFGKAKFQALAKQCFRLWQGKVSSLGKAEFQTFSNQSFRLLQSKVSRRPPLAGEITKNRALSGRFSPPNKSGFHGGTLPFRLYRLYCGRLFSPPTLFFILVFSFFSFHFGLFIPENFAFDFSRMPSSHLLTRNTSAISKETRYKTL